MAPLAVFAVFCSESSAIVTAGSAEIVAHGRFGERENSRSVADMPLFFCGKQLQRPGR
jgi:hypothetical protein